MADEDNLIPLIIEGQEVGRVRLAPPERTNRRETDLGLGVVQLPRLLETFRPSRPIPPQERFLLLLRAFCTAMNGGSRSQLDENELAKLYMATHGPAAFLHHQIYRASGDALCGVCQKPYFEHKHDRAVLNHEGQPYIRRLCNGDLVKL